MTSTTFVPWADLNDAQLVDAAHFLDATFGARDDQQTLLRQWRQAQKPGAVAFEGGEVVGATVGRVVDFASSPYARVAADAFDADAQVGALSMLAVHPRRRRQGLGRRLAGQLVDALVASDIVALVGMCWDNGSDDTSRTLYEANGFTLVAHSDTFFADEQKKSGQPCPHCAPASCHCRALLFSLAAPAPWTVYLLRCADDTLYCGITNDLQRRLAVHNRKKGARYTRSRTPVALAWLTQVPTKSDALRLEYALKQHSRSDKERLIAGTL